MRVKALKKNRKAKEKMKELKLVQKNRCVFVV